MFGRVLEIVAAASKDILRMSATLSDAKVFVIDDNIEDKENHENTLIEDAIEDIGDVAEIAAQSPVIRLVNFMIYTAVKEGASDIHVEPTGAALVRTLVDRGANPNLRSTKDTRENTTAGVSVKGATPLFLAASRAHLDTVRALLAGKADPSITTDNGTAPLHVASWGGDPNFRDWSEEEKDNLFQVTRLLVELGADVNSAGEHGWTALHGAAYKGVDAAVQFLIDRGARMEVFDEYGQTPLSISLSIITEGIGAAYYQTPRIYRKETADLLLKLGATPLERSGVKVSINQRPTP